MEQLEKVGWIKNQPFGPVFHVYIYTEPQAKLVPITT